MCVGEKERELKKIQAEFQQCLEQQQKAQDKIDETKTVLDDKLASIKADTQQKLQKAAEDQEFIDKIKVVIILHSYVKRCFWPWRGKKGNSPRRRSTTYRRRSEELKTTS